MLKERIARSETVIGSFVFLASPEMVEIMALAGMDFVIIDTEHTPKDWQVLEHMVRAANVHDLPALIRVSDNDEKLILQCLEIGAEGLVIPFVQTAEDVRTAAGAMYYPPRGTRGTCTLTRMTGYGARRRDFLQYCRDQDDRLLLFAQIEDQVGVQNIGDIVATNPGADVVLVGRSDLASSYSVPGQVEAPQVLEATDAIIGAARNCVQGPAVAMGIYSSGEIERWKDKNCSVFFAPSDGILMYNAAQSWLAALRQD